MPLLTPPAAEPVTLAEAKLAARISDTTAFDALVPGLITAAREQAEQITGQRFLAQTWRHELADWPSTSTVLPQALPTAVAVSYWTGTAWQTLAGVEFAACMGGTAIAPATGTSWPTLGSLTLGPRVRVDITSGAADATGVPEAVKLYIKALVTHWVDNPGAAPQGGSGEVDPIFTRLLDGARIYG